MKRYWLTPPELQRKLAERHEFDFDPCPCPLPDGYNSLVIPWGFCNYINPPFLKKDSPHGGPTAFVRKAIEENKQGKTCVLTLPVPSYVNLLLEAGAMLESAGRVRWLEVDTKQPMPSPTPVVIATLRGC